MDTVIREAENYIKHFFEDECSGHDYFHSMRVYHTAIVLAKREGANEHVVALAALLHDVDDIKLFPETHEKKEHANRFLKDHGVAEETIEHILKIIDEVSFRGTDSVAPKTIEGKCVQDADRLDALGAVGIARTFAYGGSHGRKMYDPDEAPALNMDEKAYRNHVSSSINHFYEKLFLLKDLMNTATGKELAVKRENYMKAFVDEFMQEWDGKDLAEQK